MQITLTIPEPYAERVAQLAQQQGITPTQWVTQLLRASLRPPQAPQHGRPAVNMARDLEITRKRQAGMTAAALAREYGVSEIRIHQICRAGR